MRVAKWGNSLAVCLPASVVEALELKESDEIDIHLADEREFVVSHRPGREQLLKRLRAFRGRLPVDFKFDWDEANYLVAFSIPPCCRLRHPLGRR